MYIICIIYILSGLYFSTMGFLCNVIYFMHIKMLLWETIYNLHQMPQRPLIQGLSSSSKKTWTFTAHSFPSERARPTGRVCRSPALPVSEWKNLSNTGHSIRKPEYMSITYKENISTFSWVLNLSPSNGQKHQHIAKWQMVICHFIHVLRSFQSYDEPSGDKSMSCPQWAVERVVC